MYLNISFNVLILSGLSMQYLAGHTDASVISFEDLADLDDAIAKSLSDGQKVVLLGPDITLANSEPNSSQQNVKDIDRHPLATDSDAVSWSGTPAKGFPGCGIIKINPKISMTSNDGTKTSVDLADPVDWTCDGGKFTIPNKDKNANLEISFKQEKSFANMIVKYGGDQYDGADAKNLPYGSKDPVFSYTCSQMNLKSTKENDESKIALGPYQIQPFCSDKCNKFTVSVVDCVPLMGEMVWATFLGFLLFSSILAGAVWAMLAIESPTRFETARSKPLIIPDHSQ